jgi:hypothetical protein
LIQKVRLATFYILKAGKQKLFILPPKYGWGGLLVWGGTGGVCLDVLTATQLSVSAFIVIAHIDYIFLYPLG